MCCYNFVNVNEESSPGLKSYFLRVICFSEQFGFIVIWHLIFETLNKGIKEQIFARLQFNLDCGF